MNRRFRVCVSCNPRLMVIDFSRAVEWLVSAFFGDAIDSEPFDGFMVVLVDDETDATAFLLAGFVSDPACPD